MKVLNILAKPVLVGVVSLAAALPLLSRDLEPEEYISSILFAFVIFSLPFVFLSNFTKKKLKNTSQMNSFFALWIVSILATLAWIALILSSDGAQAAIGFIYVPAVALVGGFGSYRLVQIFNKPKKSR